MNWDLNKGSLPYVVIIIVIMLLEKSYYFAKILRILFIYPFLIILPMNG